MLKKLIFALLLVPGMMMADSATDAVYNLAALEKTAMSNDTRLELLRSLRGDTITLELAGPGNATILLAEQPDTVWIKPRPKKNAEEGKHYQLCHAYKGGPVPSGFATPVGVVNGRQFAVLSVVPFAPSRYSTDNGYDVKLVDLDDHGVFTLRLQEKMDHIVTLTPASTQRVARSLVGKTFYIDPSDYSYGTPSYERVTLRDAGYQVRVEPGILFKMTADVTLRMVSDAGTSIPFKPKTSSYDRTFNREKLITEAEYIDRTRVRAIDSEHDNRLAMADSVLPFSFRCIYGLPKGIIANMSQTIDPAMAGKYIWTDSHKYAPEELMYVTGVDDVRGKRFYKMAYRGKAFFMRAEDVTLSADGRSMLDSLLAASPEHQSIFHHHSLFRNKARYFARLEDALATSKSYAKQGLAIQSWNLYDESDYTEGTGINITFFNPTESMIKYINITFQGYNAVDDPCGRPVTKRCIGPIEPMETGSYQFEYAWFTDIVESAKIKSITVTYKNGSTRTIAKPGDIVFDDEINELIFSTNPVADFK